MEDLHNIQVGINKKLAPVIEQRLLEAAWVNGNPEVTAADIADGYVTPMIE